MKFRIRELIRQIRIRLGLEEAPWWEVPDPPLMIPPRALLQILRRRAAL